MEQEVNFIESIKGFLSGIVVRWIMKAAGGALVGVGISEGSIVEIVGGGLSFLIGIVISLFQQKKAVNQVPPVQPAAEPK